MIREEAVIILDGFKNNPLFNSTHIRAFDMAISALSENKDGWIPIEERKPNEYDDVLVSTDIEEVFEATYYGDELGFDDNNGNFYEGEVIAWQPLPEPYKAESEIKPNE